MQSAHLNVKRKEYSQDWLCQRIEERPHAPALDRIQNPHCTVRLILTECDRLPDLPRTLTLKVPVFAEPLTVNANVLLEVEGFGLKEAVTPVGRLDAEKLTLPVKPLVGLMVIVDVPMFPRATFKLLGDAERLKSGPGATARVIVVIWVKPPDVPVIVTVTVPVVAVLLAVSVNKLVLVVLLGLNDAVTPPGRPDADRPTLPVKPLVGLMAIVDVPVLPGATFRLLGDAESPKLGPEFTVRTIVVVCVKPPDVPVIVIVMVPVVAVLLAVSANVLTLVVLLGLNDAVTPLAKPDADRPTLPAKPFCGVTVIVLAPLLPWAIVTLDGDAERLKSGGAVAFTARLTVVA
jgi:hypothetical protein